MNHHRYTLIGASTLVLLVAFFVAFGVVACDKKTTDTTSTDASGAGVTATGATAATTPTPSAGAEETEEDFEEEVQSSITEENLESELAKLEAEIK